MFGSLKRWATIVLSAAAAVIACGSPAYAAGTAAGTSINNPATLNYSVGGVAQTPINSNTVSFVVDQRINLTCAELGGAATSAAMGAVDQVFTYTVTNSSNATIDLRLSASQTGTGLSTLLGS